MRAGSRCTWSAAGRRRVHLGGRAIRFAEGETIHTENSYKHTRQFFLGLAETAGWRRVQLWTDPDDLFSIHLLEAGDEGCQKPPTAADHRETPPRPAVPDDVAPAGGWPLPP